MSMRRFAALLCGASLVGAVACAETDAGLTTKVKSKLIADDAVKAYQINVDTRDKVVTLTGTVDSETAKVEAVRITRGTEGVANVVDNIVVVVKEPPPERASLPDVTDAGLTAAVKSKLLADPDVAGLKIDVDTKDGIVTLTGKVKTMAEKEEAIRLARETTGVKDINDRLTVGR
jgi:hyperosmotically inducible protein